MARYPAPNASDTRPSFRDGSDTSGSSKVGRSALGSNSWSNSESNEPVPSNEPEPLSKEVLVSKDPKVSLAAESARWFKGTSQSATRAAPR